MKTRKSVYLSVLGLTVIVILWVAGCATTVPFEGELTVTVHGR